MAWIETFAVDVLMLYCYCFYGSQAFHSVQCISRGQSQQICWQYIWSIKCGAHNAFHLTNLRRYTDASTFNKFHIPYSSLDNNIPGSDHPFPPIPVHMNRDLACERSWIKYALWSSMKLQPLCAFNCSVKTVFSKIACLWGHFVL